ncbi:chorismate-binding protein [Maridesulfovibrio zosterae]|uniref:chorismate-binding protein n=1 Tax=Maridesulfovibrio zosterae TaxID=82171 RepID=UPI000402C3A1|nr:anthranilate synthase component I family protein [Maridesulfovibrio zosterae]
MPSIFLNSVSFEKFREIALYFVKNGNADVLLGSPLFPDSCTSYIGLTPTNELILEADIPADEIASAMRSFSFSDANPTIGYFTYECGFALRGVTSRKDRQYPSGHLKKYAAVLTHDASTETMEVVAVEEQSLSDILCLIKKISPVPEVELPDFKPEYISMSLGKESYEKGVAQTLEYIKDGLTYQLNLSTQFTINDINFDPLLWFFTLNKRYPAPYYALFKSCGKLIISTSPELFLKVENGCVRSEPIKGTLRFDEYSDDLIKQLTSSAKEDSELSMIVDLVRNDISRECKYGSVTVEKHKSVFAVDNLLQMYSVVHGELADGKDCIDLFLSAFPGGSITGCPKKSSMELIDMLEPHTRGPFCGSIVMIKGPKDLVSSIAIRTAVYDESENKLTYWAGSGIVIDSDPREEFLETMAKAGKIIDPEGM